MGTVVQLGPLALALDRLVAVMAIWLFLAAGSWIARRCGRRSGAAAWTSAAVGIVAARLAFVVENVTAYASEPVEALYFWQGGFSPAAGVAGAGLTLVVMLRSRALWMSLAVLATLSLLWSMFAIIQDRPGRALPSVAALTDVQGVPVSLDSLEGPFVINLWATWCPPCRREMPMLAETAAANPDVPIVLLNQGQPLAEVRDYLIEQRIDPRRVLVDQNGRLASEIGAMALPTTLFIGSNRQVQQVHVGEISRAALWSGIQELRQSQ